MHPRQPPPHREYRSSLGSLETRFPRDFHKHTQHTHTIYETEKPAGRIGSWEPRSVYCGWWRIVVAMKKLEEDVAPWRAVADDSRRVRVPKIPKSIGVDRIIIPNLYWSIQSTTGTILYLVATVPLLKARKSTPESLLVVVVIVASNFRLGLLLLFIQPRQHRNNLYR